MLVGAIESYMERFTRLKDPLTLDTFDLYFYCWAMQATNLGQKKVETMFKGTVNQAHAYSVDILLTHRLLDISYILYAEAPNESLATIRLKDIFQETVRPPSLEASINALKKAVSKNIKHIINPSFIVPLLLQVDWKKNQDWIGMLRNSKAILERLKVVEEELQLERISDMLLQVSQQKVGDRILRSILTKATTAQGYSLIVNVEAAALHILYLLEKVSTA